MTIDRRRVLAAAGGLTMAAGAFVLTADESEGGRPVDFYDYTAN